MKLDTLIRGSGVVLTTQNAGGVEISDLADDSRRVTAGGLFIARDTGDDRWRGYVEAAVAGGAAAVIAPAEIELPDGVALGVASRVDQALAGELAAAFFGRPAEKLKLIGVTGTNGKTTVATLTQYLLNALGDRCGLLGTVAIDDGSPQGPQPAELTTPGAIDLHRHFAAMVNHGCTACAMEVSSHALDQGRVDGLGFAAAVFTNLTQDHLDYHGTMQEYAAAKALLLGKLIPDGVIVMNSEDPGLKLMQLPDDVGRMVLTAAAHELGHADAEAWPLKLDASGSVARFEGPWGKFQATLPLIGDFNLMNALQALTAVHALTPKPQRDWGKLIEACPPVPGRVEVVALPESETAVETPAVLVDYAHTPGALSSVLATLRPLTRGRLICVFGCGGDRDRTKRPLMAEAVANGADVLWLTSDNPRTEDPQQILDDAVEGVRNKRRDDLTVEIDRATAIRGAVASASVRDTVLIAGKGHEDYQVLGTEKIHFDDREHAAQALRAWVEQHQA